jgi:hypothetical protein
MALNLIGQKFGKLTVFDRAENNKQNKRMWVCRCDCGNIKKKPVATGDLTSGAVKSCGCLYFDSNKERNKKHGKTKSRLYQIWSGIKSRCLNPQNVAFKNYGGRGITICDEWKDDFQAFYDWAISNGYRENLTIDRIDNDKGYYPKNCRWTTMKKQQNHRRNNKIVIYKNNKFTVSELAEKLNISVQTLCWRLRNGWNENDLSLPPSFANKKERKQKHE